MTPSCTRRVNKGVAPGSQLAEASGMLADPRPDRLQDGMDRPGIPVSVQQQAQPAGALGKARETFRRHYIAGVQRHPGEHHEGQIPDRRARRCEVPVDKAHQPFARAVIATGTRTRVRSEGPPDGVVRGSVVVADDVPGPPRAKGSSSPGPAGRDEVRHRVVVAA
jgi:hypothetical protein